MERFQILFSIILYVSQDTQYCIVLYIYIYIYIYDVYMLYYLLYIYIFFIIYDYYLLYMIVVTEL